MKNIPLLLTCLMFLACSPSTGEGEGESAAEGEGEGEAGEGEGEGDDCTTLTIGSVVFDYQDDTETDYSAPITTNLGDVTIDDVLVMKFVNQGARFEMPTGTFELGSGINANFETCAECILVFEDQAGLVAPPRRVFSPTAGTITLDTDPRDFILRGTIDGIVLREATIVDFQTTFVDGGACVRFEQLSFDYKVVPTAWTCSEDIYRDGTTCNCDCGAEDPDCYQPERPVVGCNGGDICNTGVCAEPCDSLAPNPTCAPGTYCGPVGPFDVCTDNAAQIDPAGLGEPCAPIVGDPFFDPPPPYCAFEGGLVTGLCAYVGDEDERICQPLCGTRDDCDAANSEDCVVIYSETFLRGEPGRGFCANIVPAEWTCDPDRYYDDETCDCGCGDRDLDCDFGDLPNAGCSDDQQCSNDQRCVSAPANESCATAELIVPGTYTADSTLATNDVDYPGGIAGCGEDAAPGNDVVYAVDVTVGQIIRVTATGTGNFFFPYVFILGSGDNPCATPLTQCLASSNSFGEPFDRVAEAEVTAANIGDGRFYIVVDNPFGDFEGGPFTLTLEQQ